jgi:hypothetical protein
MAMILVSDLRAIQESVSVELCRYVQVPTSVNVTTFVLSVKDLLKE